MILTVTPNPAVDLTWHVDRLTPAPPIACRPVRPGRAARG